MSKLLAGVGLMAFAALILVTLAGVADRFVLGLGLVWTEELARYILIWTSFLAAALAATRHAHFQIELLPDRLGPVYRAAIAAIAAAICLVAAWYGVKFAWMFRDQHSPALGLSMAWVYSAAPFGLLLIAASSARVSVTALRSARKARVM